MRTTHGAHIPGTRLGTNPPSRPTKCGGIEHCIDCRLEAAAVTTKIDYSHEEYCDDLTLNKVYISLREAGVMSWMADEAIKRLQSNGILFRERKTT